jgi:hypothetical protein
MTSEDFTDIRSRRPAMMDALDEEPATAASPNTVTGHVSLNQEISAKRRKVRKGTRCCWECKRRKIRCIFASSEDVTCLSCQRRRTPCVSQDMPEDLSPARKGNRHLGERIARIEDFMKGLLASKDVGATSRIEGEPRQGRRSNSDTLKPHSNNSAPSTIRAPPTPAEVRQAPIITLNVFLNCHLVSWRMRSKFITPHTRLARCIRPSRDRNIPLSLICSLYSRRGCQDPAQREL